MTATPTLFAGLVDDAGLFPPADLSMAHALRRHFGDGPNPIASGRFLCPEARLVECLALIPDGRPLHLALICDLTPDQLSSIERAYPVATEVMVHGPLQRGGLFTIQLEGGRGHRKTGVQIVITGTKGALRITNSRGFENQDDNTLEDLTGDATSFSPLGIPDEYVSLPKNHLDASVQDVAYLYDAYAPAGDRPVEPGLLTKSPPTLGE